MKFTKLILTLVIATIFCNNSFAQINKKIAKKENQQLNQSFKSQETYIEEEKSWSKIKCVSENGFICTQNNCKNLDLAKNSYIILDQKSQIISLCKDEICKFYPADFTQNGEYVDINIQEANGIFIKVLNGSEFKEVSMAGLDSYLTNGKCQNVQSDENLF